MLLPVFITFRFCFGIELTPLPGFFVQDVIVSYSITCQPAVSVNTHIHPNTCHYEIYNP